MEEIKKYGVEYIPSLVINDTVVVEGKVPSISEMLDIISSFL